MRFVNILWSAAVYIGTCAILYNRRWDEKRKASSRFKGSGTTGKKKAPSVAKTKESLIKIAPLPTVVEEKPDVVFKAKVEATTPVKVARPRVLPSTEAKKSSPDFSS